MRKLLVNAQIKAMISLVELLSNVGYILLVAFTTKTSYITLIQIMMLYMIVLPYAFLMNTSHNKNRIIEHGWKNIVRNIFVKPNMTISQDTDNSLHEIKTLSNVKSDDNKKSSNVSMDVFVTETSGIPSVLTDNMKALSKNTINDGNKPSTSGEQRIRVKSPSRRLISKMLNAIENEDEYIKVFQSFVMYIDHCKRGNDPRKFQFDENNFPCNQTLYTHTERNAVLIKVKSSTNKSKNHKTKGKSNLCPTYPTSFDSNDDKAVLKGNKEYRVSSRREILYKLRSSRDSLESFKDLGEQLIDLEESFIT